MAAVADRMGWQMKALRWITVIAAMLWLTGCAGTFSDVKNPRLSIARVEVMPSAGLMQYIRVGVRVVNPNPFAIEASGVYMQVSFNDVTMLDGVASDLPVVEAYSESEFTMNLSTNLLSGLRFVAALLEKPGEVVTYRIEADVELSSPIGRKLQLLEQGEIAPRTALRRDATTI